MVHLAQHIENIKNHFSEIDADPYESIWTIKISVKSVCVQTSFVQQAYFFLYS